LFDLKFKLVLLSGNSSAFHAEPRLHHDGHPLSLTLFRPHMPPRHIAPIMARLQRIMQLKVVSHVFSARPSVSTDSQAFPGKGKSSLLCFSMTCQIFLFPETLLNHHSAGHHIVPPSFAGVNIHGPTIRSVVKTSRGIHGHCISIVACNHMAVGEAALHAKQLVCKAANR
jgi:hypothetical protein